MLRFIAFIVNDYRANRFAVGVIVVATLIFVHICSKRMKRDES